MRWTSKNRMWRSLLYDENQKLAAEIEFHKGKIYISDQKKQRQLFLEEPTPLRIEIHGRNSEGRAEILLSPESALFCPPRAEKLFLIWGEARISMSQKQGRDFIAESSGRPVMKIQKILDLTSMITIYEKMDPVMAALLYGLAIRMLHEDDVDIL